MLQPRPFGSAQALLFAAARASGTRSANGDWREAFAHHPQIGDRAALRQRFPATHDLSAREQAGVAGASETVLDALPRRNRRYAARFGYIFIVCATGLSAEQMLATAARPARQRAGARDSSCGEEQAKITALRLK